MRHAARGTGAGVLLVALLLDPLSGQTPQVSAGFRPTQVRIGGRVILTVRVDAPGETQPAIELVHAPEVDLLEVVDRTRAGHWERDFVLEPTGLASDPWIVEVAFPEHVVTREIDPPVVHPAPGLSRPDPAPAGTERRPPRDGAQSPPVGNQGIGGQPFAPSGGAGLEMPGWAYAGGWAATAHLDPWWAEVVPEVYAYDVATADPLTGVSLEAALARRRVYVGQQITLVATVSVPPGEVGYRPRYWPPEPGAFARVPIGAQGHPTLREGDLEYGATFRTAYFPLSPGEWAFPTGGLYSRGRNPFTGPAIPVVVLPVPNEGAPPGYAGAVGRFQISAGVDPVSLEWGQSGLLWIEVRGVGDMRNLPAPVPPRVYGARLTPYRDRVFLEARDGVAGGVKTFLYLLTPVESGPVEIDPILFPYFDPYIEAYSVLATGEMSVQVRP
ncbi:MAG: hypothetical protein HKO53_15935 [Gemmatimonadetes bacterium]|nr:hypothetical protein [Gemmatimonadota bacterium]